MADDSAKTRAQQAATLLQTLYKDPRDPWWMSTGFWHSANALQSLVDYMARTGDEGWAPNIAHVLEAFLAKPDFGYTDDEGWWGIAFQSAHDLAGQPASLLTTACKIADDMIANWDSKRGGVWWKRTPRTPPSYPQNLIAGISTELLMDLAGRLANTPGVPRADTYLGWAKKCWQWLQGALIDRDSLVWGQLSASATSPVQVYQFNPPYTYTQGVVLGGLIELQKAEPSGAYLDPAIQIAEACLTFFAKSDPGVHPPARWLAEHCEATPYCSNDAKQFKGVYMRYLRRLVDALAAADPGSKALARLRQFITQNADSLWTSYQDPGKPPQASFGMSWHRPPGPFTPSGTRYVAGTLQSSALDALNAAIDVAQSEPGGAP